MRRTDLSLPRFIDLMVLILLGTSLLIVVAKLALFYRNADLALDIGPSGWALLAIAMGLYVSAHVMRVARLHIIIGVGRMRFATLMGFHSVVALATFFIPFKLGDVVRAVEIFRLLKDDMRGPFAVWIDRLLDAAMLIFVLIGLGFAGLPLGNSSFGIILKAALFVLCASGFVVLFAPGAVASLARAMLPSSSKRSLVVLAACNHLMQVGRQFPRLELPTLSLLLIVTLAIWTCELGAIVLILVAVFPPTAGLPIEPAEIYARVLVASSDGIQGYVAVYYALALVSLSLLAALTAGRYFRSRTAIIQQSRSAPVYRATSPFSRPHLDIRGRTR